MKRYRLPLSRVFPAAHPREGEETNFFNKIQFTRNALNSESPVLGQYDIKLHTIRKNVEYWSKRIDEILKGNAVLEVYEWTGAPYKSKAKTLFTLDKDSGIGYQKLELTPLGWFINDYDSDVDSQTLAKNDGLSYEDFKNWFKKVKLNEPMIIIHFTSFRY